MCCNFKPTGLQFQAYKVSKNLCQKSELGLSETQLYFSHCQGKTPICKMIFLLLLHLVPGIREYLHPTLGHFPKSSSFSITLRSTLPRAALFDHVIVGKRHSLKESEFFYLSLNTFSANFINYLKLSCVKNVKKIQDKCKAAWKNCSAACFMDISHFRISPIWQFRSDPNQCPPHHMLRD